MSQESKETPQSLMDTARLSMFHPSSKGDLLADYPELRKVPAFMAVDNASKMRFVWFYACKSSRARELNDDKDRIEYAMLAAWNNRVPKEIRDTFPKKNWGQEVSEAIRAMRDFEPGPRIEAKMLFAKKIKQVKDMLDETPGELKTWADKQEFFKATKVGLELLKDMMPYAEQASFGIVEKSDEQEFQEQDVIATLIKNRD